MKNKLGSRIKRIVQNIFQPYSSNRLNVYYEKEYSHKHKQIHIFYHIFAYNNWREIFDEQITALKQSGLYDEMYKLHVSVISSDSADIDYILKNIGDKGTIIYISDNPKVYEFPSLIELKKVADQTDCLVLYFHTKGSSNSIDTLKWYYPRVKSLKRLRLCSRSWRKFMEYFTIFKWRTAISVLRDFDTYGCYLRHQQKFTFYAGNFWWARSEHIRNLKPFTQTDLSYRYAAETWLLGINCKIYDAFRLNADLTSLPIPASSYSSDNKLTKLLGGAKFWVEYIWISTRLKSLSFYNCLTKQSNQ